MRRPSRRRIRKRREDAFEHLSDFWLTDRDAAARVIFERRVVGVQRENGVDVVPIPRFVVAADDSFQILGHESSYHTTHDPKTSGPNGLDAGANRLHGVSQSTTRLAFRSGARAAHDAARSDARRRGR